MNSHPSYLPSTALPPWTRLGVPPLGPGLPPASIAAFLSGLQHPAHHRFSSLLGLPLGGAAPSAPGMTPHFPGVYGHPHHPFPLTNAHHPHSSSSSSSSSTSTKPAPHAPLVARISGSSSLAPPSPCGSAASGASSSSSTAPSTSVKRRRPSTTGAKRSSPRSGVPETAPPAVTADVGVDAQGRSMNSTPSAISSAALRYTRSSTQQHQPLQQMQQMQQMQHLPSTATSKNPRVYPIDVAVSSSSSSSQPVFPEPQRLRSTHPHLPLFPSSLPPPPPHLPPTDVVSPHSSINPAHPFRHLPPFPFSAGCFPPPPPPPPPPPQHPAAPLDAPPMPSPTSSAPFPPLPGVIGGGGALAPHPHSVPYSLLHPASHLNHPPTDRLQPPFLPPHNPSALFHPLNSPPLLFTRSQLEAVLYGYAKGGGGRGGGGGGGGGADGEKGSDGGGGHVHALSGMRIAEGGRVPRSEWRQPDDGAVSPSVGTTPPTSAPASHLGFGGAGAGNGANALTPATPVTQALDGTPLDLPEGLRVFQTVVSDVIHYGVFNENAIITKGTKFGPFQGRTVNTSEIKTNDDNSFMWEIFHEGRLSHFVDGRASSGNWMSYVNCARFAGEQNLVAIQIDDDIFYEVCKDVPQGTELLVWYGDSYLQFMGIPVALKETEGAMTITDAQNECKEGYTCERCGKVFAYKYYRDKHLKYTRCVDQGDRKFPCHLCNRSFEKRDRLRIHILHVHEKHRPHKCSVCGKSFSQSSSLNKHMRVHSGERPYKCVYCSKAFTASSILRTHIRQHSGEKPFKCKHCGKSFASHAAHDSHVRRTHAKDKLYSCNVCAKSFAQSYELKFHKASHSASERDSSPRTPGSSSDGGGGDVGFQTSPSGLNRAGSPFIYGGIAPLPFDLSAAGPQKAVRAMQLREMSFPPSFRSPIPATPQPDMDIDIVGV